MCVCVCVCVCVYNIFLLPGLVSHMNCKYFLIVYSSLIHLLKNVFGWAEDVNFYEALFIIFSFFGVLENFCLFSNHKKILCFPLKAL